MIKITTCADLACEKSWRSLLKKGFSWYVLINIYHPAAEQMSRVDIILFFEKWLFWSCFHCFVTKLQTKKQKLFLMSWCPDTAKIKKKMLYSSSFDALKQALEGVGKYIQVREYNRNESLSMYERNEGSRVWEKWRQTNKRNMNTWMK